MGLDYALRPRERISEITEQLHIPVYGLKNGNKAFLAIIEEGDAYAIIKADIAGRYQSIILSMEALLQCKEQNLFLVMNGKKPK